MPMSSRSVHGELEPKAVFLDAIFLGDFTSRTLGCASEPRIPTCFLPQRNRIALHDEGVDASALFQGRFGRSPGTSMRCCRGIQFGAIQRCVVAHVHGRGVGSGVRSGFGLERQNAPIFSPRRGAPGIFLLGFCPELVANRPRSCCARTRWWTRQSDLPSPTRSLPCPCLTPAFRIHHHVYGSQLAAGGFRRGEPLFVVVEDVGLEDVVGMKLAAARTKLFFGEVEVHCLYRRVSVKRARPYFSAHASRRYTEVPP